MNPRPPGPNNTPSPEILPLPGPEVFTLYTDASWRGSGRYGWAYVRDHLGSTEEAWGIAEGAAHSAEAEIVAATWAIEQTSPPEEFCLVFDNTTLADLITGKAVCRTWAAERFVMVAASLKPVLRWFPGHHKTRTPPHLARCDWLARGTIA